MAMNSNSIKREIIRCNEPSRYIIPPLKYSPPKNVKSESDISIKTSNLRGKAETESCVKPAFSRTTSNTHKERNSGLTTPVIHKEITIWEI